MTSPSAPADAAAHAHVHFWRTVAEAEGREDETRHGAVVVPPVSRRSFLALMGASIALAGSAGCSRAPLEKIVPYRDGAQQQTYGTPVYYASGLDCSGGDGIGVLVECNMGRPTKIEGNPQHPASLGATDPFVQASILELWDPDRSQHSRQGSRIATFGDAAAAMQDALRAAPEGRGVHILTETVTSPSLHAAMQSLLRRMPKARWHQWQPVNRDNVHAGTTLAFGAALDPVFHFDRARCIVALDADFLSAFPGHVRYALDFATTRRASAPATARSRLYVVETAHSLTGVAADHRLARRAADVGLAAQALAHALGVTSIAPARDVVPQPWLTNVVADLRASGSAALCIAGASQPAHVHALAHAINERLGASGNTVSHVVPVAAEPVDHIASLRDLAERMHAGEVEMLLIAGANPVYTAPADFQFADALARVPLTLHHGLHYDETAARCHWHVSAAHPLESWGDVTSYDGTIALQQPCIAPLYDGTTARQVLAALAGDAISGDRALFETYWRTRLGNDFDARLEDALRRGVLAGSSAPPVAARIRGNPDGWLAAAAPARTSDVDLLFVPDPRVGDGRFANNSWLQELPKPLSQLTWDNAAEMSSALAARLGVENGDLVELHIGVLRALAPAWVVPGIADATIVLALGYGRSHAGAVGNGRGVDAYRLRSSLAPWVDALSAVGRATGRYALASAQTHGRMEGRDIVRTLSAAAAAACTSDGCASPHPRDERTLYDSPPLGPYAWAMSIDLSACIGCGTCTIACQAENNIPTVGKDEVMRGREMHWIRVDRYFSGSVENARAIFQPVPCMQCEHAPCEVVCPVEASVHDAQGINVQVYNRCVGTRFCSNNCPYKVRRFNFLQYSEDIPQLDAQRNPEVTVRMRGVMEKCNYCLQRITRAKIDADRGGRRLRDGDVVTACQAACPTRAIVFGDGADPQSEVSRQKRSPLDYALLAELNTRPRTTYLPRVVNPAAALTANGGESGVTR